MKNDFLNLIIKTFGLVLGIIYSSVCYAQPPCHFKHYGLEDGLPQHTIMGILQDKKGFMWFSTWDGLCKFDGYNFTTYKSHPGDSYLMKSNRIDIIHEDKYNNIWLHSYDKEAHRFDPKTEQFTSIHSQSGESFLTSKISTKSSGKVWLLSETMGAICVIDSTLKCIYLNTENGKLTGNSIFQVFEDSSSNSWVLTNNGLTKLSKDNKECLTFFAEKEVAKTQQIFLTALELKDEIWFGSNKGRIWKYKKQNATFFPLEMNTISNIISLKKITEDTILILTADDGFLIYNTRKNAYKQYNKSNITQLPTNEMVSAFVDNDQNIWIELNYPGVSKFNTKTLQFKHYISVAQNRNETVFPPNFLILEDKNNRVWIHPRGGGFSLYDKQTDELQPFYNDLSLPNWRFSSMLHSAYSDRQGNLWLSTRSHGLEKIVFDNLFFKLSIISPQTNAVVENEVRAIFEDTDQNIWLSSKDGKTTIYDSNWNLKGYLGSNGIVNSGEPLKGTAYSIIQDSKKRIWIGTKGEGLYLITKNTDQEKKTFNIKKYKNEIQNIYSLSNNNIYTVFEDIKGRIWIGTYGGGLNLFDETSDKFINHRNNLSNYPIDIAYQIRTLGDDKYGNIYIGSTIGLIVFSSDFKTTNSINYKIYSREPNNVQSLSGNNIFDISTTSKGETYIATFGGGICKVDKTTKEGFPISFKTYNVENGLPSDVILSITEDQLSKLWVSSEGYLTRFDPDKESFETFSEINRLIDKQNFSEAKSIRTHNGEIIFGCSRGIVRFTPDKIINNTFNPYVSFVKLRISNRDISIDDKGILNKHVDDTPDIKLNHTQNFLSIEYAALDFVEPQNILYAYKLDGFDKEWIYSQKQRIANYTNLSPGNYIFRVKSTNSDGVWVDNERILRIDIHPSFWQTRWAYFLYFIFFSITIFAVLRILFVFYRLQDKVKLEYEQTEMKTRFFTDISHEIRTPLTMIVSPVENIIEDDETPQNIKSQLGLVLKNANRMLRMVNQILDFRKIQKQKLNIQLTDFARFVIEICNNFSKTAEIQNTSFEMNNQLDGEKLWIDRDGVEKIIFNLLSNAFKFTNSGNSIFINISRKDNCVLLQVKDEGIGMTKDVISKLFARFSSFNSDKSKPSTGIGLSIVKELADKHHARIMVESEVGKGSSFTLFFQMGLDHFKDDENINIFETSKEIERNDSPKELKSISTNDTDRIDAENVEHEFSVLVVEDDDDLRNFIKVILAPYYTLHEASNGKEGLKVATQILPDFIVSDLMMPEMDGIELLQNIRTNIATSHIPFLLLTAKTSMDSKIESMEYGVDDYITKPFSVSYFRARIENILKQRKQLKNRYNSFNQQPDTLKTEIDQPLITKKDEDFLKKVINEIESHIDNSDFVVDDLVKALAMSRTVFFKKIKSLTGLAPIEFVREYRIKYAAHLILNTDYSIKEISFMVGIIDTKYFTKCFKIIYSTTPSEYRARNKS